jgi:hypothetical protein
MVNFICDACGQTIKKQKVEKHYQTECRNCNVLSCIDCGKDFPGDSYASHTSCISEAEKYQGKLYKGKDKANKGERKQQEWLEVISLRPNSIGICVRVCASTLKCLFGQMDFSTKIGIVHDWSVSNYAKMFNYSA